MARPNGCMDCPLTVACPTTGLPVSAPSPNSLHQPNPTAMEHPELTITAYLKTHCGWSEGVRAIFRKYGLAFEEKDIIKNPAFRWEMEHKSGQPLSPCVEINGQMLADVSGAEIENWLLEQGLLVENDAIPDAPIDSSCTDEQHLAMQRAAVSGIRLVD